MRFKRKHGVRGGRELVGLGGGVSFLTCFGCVLCNAGVSFVVPTEWSSGHSQQCLEHARAHAFGVGRQTQLVAVGWVLFIFMFLCFVACSFCPSFLSLSFFGCPSLFLVLSGLLFAGVFFFDVCLVWLVSFFFVARCPASYKKGGKGEGAVARRLLLRFRLTLGTEGPNRDLRGSRMRDTDEVARLQHTSPRQTAAADGWLPSLSSAPGRVSAALGVGGRWGEARGVWPKFGEGGQAR